MAYKLIDFMKYCHACIHISKDEAEEPCCSCLEESINEDSEKPLYFEPKEEYKNVVPYKEVK